MTMNSSGPISLGGATAGQSINLENGFSATAQVSLNDTAVRNLAGVASGAITMPTNFYGKSNRAVISYTYSANTANASLNVASLGGYVAGKSDITITVNSGVYIYSTSTGNAGLTLTGGTTGDTITLVNNGYIMGMGGKGCGWNGNYGQTESSVYGLSTSTYMTLAGAGGTALSLGFNTTINNTNASAYIGGGGGGGGAYYGSRTAGGGAGGGAGGTAIVTFFDPCSGYYYSGSTETASGGSVGATGSNGGTAGGNYGAGGGGGRIFPGVGGAQTGGSSGGSGYAQGGYGGGSGASGGVVVSFGTTAYGGAGGSANAAGGSSFNSGAYDYGAGGGGGWGASGGSNSPSGASAPYGRTGAAGGKAVALNGNTVTWTSGNTTRVYGSVA